MKLLYISEDYLNTKVHHNLCENLSKIGIDVTVYTVARKASASQHINNTFGTASYSLLRFDFDGCESLYKFDFFHKIMVKYGYLKRNIDLSRFDVVMASTVFSEGAVALRIKHEYNIPYIVCVRGTDVNFYFRRMPHLWLIGRSVITAASRIIPITRNLLNNLGNRFAISGLKNILERNSTFINNGIDQIWIDNYSPRQKQERPNRILFIGHLEENKNIVRLQVAIADLKPRFPDIRLTIIGGQAECYDTVMQLCEQNPDTFSYLGKIYDKEKLLQIVREHDIFAMVSHSETFGLVYVEAMSQGLPVLYTKGQGIDGVFSKKIGEAVISTDEESIKDGLSRLIMEYKTYDSLSREEIGAFSWIEVAKKYSDILSEAIKN